MCAGVRGGWRVCCFIRGKEGRPLSQFPFELRSRGSKRVGKWGKNILGSGTANTKTPK